jgi:predicted TIM-barrel fold metal-dependent hydrolase
MKIGNDSALLSACLRGEAATACPIIDMHGHWRRNPEYYLPSARDATMLESLDRHHIETIVCSSHTALLVDLDRGNAEMQEAIDAHPGRILGYWAINPNLSNDRKEITRKFESSRGFIGLKALPDYHGYPLDGERYRWALEWANADELVMLVHTWGGSACNSPQLLETVARRYPDVTFLMGHSGYGDWEESTRIARELDNVFLELTAVYAAHDFGMFPHGSGTPVPLNSRLQVNGIIEYMVGRVTSKKILFGTDMPWYSPSFAAGSILFARINDDEKRDILYNNAKAILARCSTMR